MLVRTPPMGWNSWNTFGERIDDALIRQTADAMVDGGYLAAGYQYLIIDDCWSLRRRGADGRIIPDPKKFPHGMKALADYVHGKGLKFGMYSDAGLTTCAGYPGSYDHEFVDAQTFADWGVDYLKYDFCAFPRSGSGRIRYQTMAMALKATGRDILFAACNWGSEDCAKWMRTVGADTYRSTGDIQDSFPSAMGIVSSQLDKLYASAPNCFNDMDMLTVGMYGKGNVAFTNQDATGKELLDREYETQFALWATLGTPLILGGDIRSLSPFCASLVKNPALIALNQDEECRAPFIHSQGTNDFIFLRHLSGGKVALGFVNGDDYDRRMNAYFPDLGLPYASGYALKLKNVLRGGEETIERDYMTLDLKPHSCAIYTGEMVRVG